MAMFLCHPCSMKDISAEAVTFCSDCNEGLCSTCLDGHKSNPANALHRINEVGSIRGCTFAATEVKVTEFKGNVILPAPKKLKCIGKIEVKQGGGHVYISSLAVTDDSRLLLCNTRSKHLLVYTSNGEYLEDCTLNGEPWDIAIIPGGKKAVVTLESVSSIQFVDIAPVKPGRTLAMPGKCYGITVIQNYICIGGRSIIHIFDNSGRQVSSIDINHNGFVWYLHPGPQNTIYYTSYDFNEIACVKLNGDQCFKYENRILGGPEAIASDHGGSLYVACRESQNIQRFSCTGSFQGAVLSSKEGIRRPYGIAFDGKCTKLFVSNNDGQSISIFSCQ